VLFLHIPGFSPSHFGAGGKARVGRVSFVFFYPQFSVDFFFLVCFFVTPSTLAIPMARAFKAKISVYFGRSSWVSSAVCFGGAAVVDEMPDLLQRGSHPVREGSFFVFFFLGYTIKDFDTLLDRKPFGCFRGTPGCPRIFLLFLRRGFFL